MDQEPEGPRGKQTTICKKNWTIETDSFLKRALLCCALCGSYNRECQPTQLCRDRKKRVQMMMNSRQQGGHDWRHFAVWFMEMLSNKSKNPVIRWKQSCWFML